MAPSKRNGFTLVEISVVLVIIALIVGGILVGQDMVVAAMLRAQLTQIDRIQSAVNTFRLKYNCLPGDCATATNLFGINSNGGCPGLTNASSTGTCNGNGDGILNAWWVYGPIDAGYAYQQLNLAELFPGHYRGSNNAAVFPGQEIPSSPFNPKIGVQLFSNTPNGAGPTVSFIPAYTLIIQIGSLRTDNAAGDFLQAAGLNAEQAHSLDAKINDGNPNTGFIRGTNGTLSGYGNPYTSCLSGSHYVTGANTGCIVYFWWN